MRKTSLNAYILFLHQLFDLAVSSRAIADSPASRLKTLRLIFPPEQIRDLAVSL